jgi:hypothetical protein
MRVTDCECSGAGWCPRHHCEKDSYWVQMCRRMPALFAAWEQGQGPGQAPAAPRRPPRQPCVSLGELLRTEACPACQGVVRLKVFACALHQECTLARRLPDAACCQECLDYRPRDAC